MDPELWFPPSEAPPDGSDRRRLQLALDTCNEYCPVRDACLVYAVTTGQRDGVWGGMLAKARANSKECRRIRQGARAS
jgi:WhiB family redox-sensing transcriptional regulator